jgi:S1-C subfamily serine protease
MYRAIPPKRLRLPVQSFVLAALLLGPRSLVSQSPSAARPAPNSSRSAGAPRDLSAEEIFRRFASRILFLECDLSAEEFALASGVLVSADGFVVTNAHVVEGCRTVRATWISGASHQSYKAVLKYYDQKSDTALLKIDGEGLDFFSVHARPARIGERVYSIGNPEGYDQSISEGIVSGKREEDGASWIQHSASISHGSSGGALISAQGDLLGINSHFVKEAQNLNFAVPVSALARAYSSARALAGFLKFPESPPVSKSQTPPVTDPPPDPSPPTPFDPEAPRLRRGPPQDAPLPAPPVPVSGLPSGDPVIQGARDANLAFAKTLPSYAVQQITTRYSGSRYVDNWRAMDVVTADVASVDGKEDYRNIRVNGQPTTRPEDSGSWSTGEFQITLEDIFSPMTVANFKRTGEDRIAGRPTWVYSLNVEQPRSHWTLVAQSGRKYTPAYKGNVWIDKETGRTLRIERQAIGMPFDFAYDKADSALQYGFVTIDGQKYLLPIESVNMACMTGASGCSRDVIAFKNYRKASTGAVHFDPVIQAARVAAGTFIETLPNYVVKQFTTRYYTEAAKGNRTSWRALDVVTSDLRFENGAERYSNTRINGTSAKVSEFDNHIVSLSSSEAGSWSTGEFAIILQGILAPQTNADFHNKRATTIVNRAAYKYDYSVEQPNSNWEIHASAESYHPAYTGTIWIDKENSRVIRIEMAAKNLPSAFPLDAVESALDYDYVPISDQRFLLPAHSETLNCTRGTAECRRNVIDFRNYEKLTDGN